MTSRVVAAEVKEIITTDIKDEVVESNFIETANAIVTEQLGSSTLTDLMLKKIEQYLAAHFVALTEEGGGLIGDKVGESSSFYANIYKAGLKSTRFGQQALAFDTTGALEALSTNSLRAEFRVV